MPRAVFSDVTKRYELKTCPPDGFVVIKRMTHGQKLQRADLSSKLSIDASSKKNAKTEIDLMQRAATLWEFANLIAEHNLEDVDGRTLNFKDVRDVEKIDGRIAEEIATHLSDLNNYEDDEDDPESELGKSSGE